MYTMADWYENAALNLAEVGNWDDLRALVRSVRMIRDRQSMELDRATWNARLEAVEGILAQHEGKEAA